MTPVRLELATLWSRVQWKGIMLVKGWKVKVIGYIIKKVSASVSFYISYFSSFMTGLTLTNIRFCIDIKC